jgi:hypothetical protein
MAAVAPTGSGEPEDSLAARLAEGDGSAEEAGFGSAEEEGEEGARKDGDDTDLATGDEKKKRKGGVRKRRTASDLNLLRDPEEIIVDLTEEELQRLAGGRKLHNLRYPTYIVCTHENFQLRALDGLQAIKGTALKELDLSHNKLMVLDALEQVRTLTLWPPRPLCLAPGASRGATSRHPLSPP